MSRVKGKVVDLAAVYRDTCAYAAKLERDGACVRPVGPVVHDFGNGHERGWDGLDGEIGLLFSDLRSPAKPGACRFAVSTDDTVSAGIRVSKDVGYPVLILNFASKNLPGGAVSSGVLAQEECIFRQTALSLALPPGSRPSCYPMPPGRVVVCRDVAVVKGAHPVYDRFSAPFPLLDVATSAAEQKPGLSHDGQHYADDTDMKMRVESVLQAAVRNGSRHLVLGAWGCGGFRNPARGLAELFHRVLLADGYAQFFAYVEFAIPGSSKHIDPFLEIFGGHIGDCIPDEERPHEGLTEEISTAMEASASPSMSEPSA